MKTIKDMIVESGRLETIYEILKEIEEKASASIPVEIQFDTNGNTISRVSGEDTKYGIELWYKLIDTTGEHITDEESNRLFALSAVVDSKLEMRLHNYANACSHRHFPAESELEEIRAYEVLDSSLHHMVYRLMDENNRFIPFDIPEGWKVA